MPRELLFAVVGLVAVLGGLCESSPKPQARAAVGANVGEWRRLGGLTFDDHVFTLRTDEFVSYARGDIAPTIATIALELPPELRTKNWGGGSCVHASNVNLLKWMGLAELATWWRANYSGGEYDSRLIKRLEAAKLRYAYVHAGADRNGNGKDDGEEFIEWACRTRRGCGIFYKPVHSINCVGIDANYVYLLDNNATDYPERVGHYERVPRADFFRLWRTQYGGFAWTLIYQPPPTTPKG